MSTYPRVLVVALGRINKKDTYNNGLFLRNVFGTEWPRDHLAQIYSSGSTNDSGFFGHYYCIGSRDRTLGSIFYRFKPSPQDTTGGNSSAENKDGGSGFKVWLRKKFTTLFVDSGLYELIFRPKLSVEMKEWVNDFNPDIILAQGYNLTFSWLPLMLKEATGAKLAVLTTDDWPTYLYSGMLGENSTFSWLVRPFVKRAAQELFSQASVPFAFGYPMADEYRQRYRQNFLVINHADDPKRFENAVPVRVHNDCLTIMAIGTFNRYRLPLLLDADIACKELNRLGIKVRLAVVSSFIEDDSDGRLSKAQFIDVLPDPGNSKLPTYLKGADAFLLAEGFDAGFVSAIKLSISSKAHLFMFSRKPIVVYADANAGISQYAKKYAWAAMVMERDTNELVKVFKAIFCDSQYSNSLISRASEVANDFHTYASNQIRFQSAMSSLSE